MKKLFIAVISMAALASCAQEDIVINNANNAIAFDNAFVSTTTKAIDPSITTDNIVKEKFYVWGTTQGDHAANAPIVPIFTEEEVAFEDNNWTYAANKTQYWIAGNKYNFAAVVNGTVETLENGLPKTITYTADGKTDLLYARSAEDIVAKATNNGKVGFTFGHLLSKAVFTFKNTTPAAAAGSTQPANIYKVTNIRVSGLDAGADYVIENGVGAWTNNTNGDREEYFGDIVAANETEVKSAAEIKEQQIGKSNYERLLIPGTHNNVTITCTITLYNGYVDDTRIVDVINYNKTVQLTFHKGVAYNLILKAGLQQSIEFKVTEVENWNDPYTNVNTPEQGHDNTPSA